MFVVFFVVDFIWLGAIGGEYYRRELGDLLRARFKLGPAGAFYLLYLVGIVYFAVAPAHDASSLADALFRGAFLGLIAYGTYDLTSYAVVRGWPLAVSLVDMAWGTALTGVTAVVGFFAARWIL